MAVNTGPRPGSGPLQIAGPFSNRRQFGVDAAGARWASDNAFAADVAMGAAGVAVDSLGGSDAATLLTALPRSPSSAISLTSMSDFTQDSGAWGQEVLSPFKFICTGAGSGATRWNNGVFTLVHDNGTATIHFIANVKYNTSGVDGFTFALNPSTGAGYELSWDGGSFNGGLTLNRWSNNTTAASVANATGNPITTGSIYDARFEVVYDSSTGAISIYFDSIASGLRTLRISYTDPTPLTGTWFGAVEGRTNLGAGKWWNWAIQNTGDLAKATDVATRAATVSNTGSDSLGGSDAVDVTAQPGRAADSAAAVDAAAGQLSLSRTTSDSTPATDVAAGSFAQSRTGTDSLGGTDATDRTLVVVGTAVDALGGTDVAGATVVFARTTSDSAGASDGATVARQMSFLRTAADNAAVSDAAARAAQSLARTGSDTAAATDSAHVTAQPARASDGAPATDVVARALSLPRVASDSAPETDEPPVSVTDNFNRANSNLDGTTTSDGSQVWVRLTTGSFASSSGVLAISSNEVIHAGGLGSFLAGDVVPCQSSDGTVTITVTTTPTSVAAVGLIGRWDAATGNCYRAFYKNGNFNIIEDKGFSNGLAFVAGTLSAGDVLSFVMSGSSLVLKKNGTTVASGTASITIASSTHGALLLDNGTSAPHFDNFSFTTSAPSNTRVVTHPRTGADSAVATDVATQHTQTSRATSDSVAATDVATRSVQSLVRSTSDSAVAVDIASRSSQALARTTSDAAPAKDEPTTITDNFNRATDFNTMGTTSDGKATWQQAQRSWGIINNTAAFVGFDGLAYLDLGTPDVVVQVTYVATAQTGGSIALAVRSSIDFSNYFGIEIHKNGVTSQAVKCVGFATSTLGSTFTAQTGDVLRIEASGNTVTFKRNGTVIATDTSGSFSTVTTHGFVTRSYLPSQTIGFDNFSLVVANGVAPTRVLVAPRTGTDAAAATDVVVGSAPLARTGSDSLGGSDAAIRSARFARATSDGAAATDLASRSSAFARTTADVQAATDSAPTSLVLARVVGDSAPTSEAVAVAARGVNASDLMGGSDVASRLLTTSRSVSDAEVAVDVAIHTTVEARTVSDSLPTSETTIRTPPGQRSMTDNAQASDVASRTATYARTGSDSEPASDVATGRVSVARSSSDAAPATDAAVRAAGQRARSTSDSEPAADAATRASQSVARAAGDGAAALDTPTRAVRVPRAGADAAGATDAATCGLQLGRFVSDGAAAVETASAAMRLLRTLVDTAGASDAATVHVSVQPRDIEVTLYDRYDPITLGSARLADVQFDPAYDHIVIDPPEMIVVNFGLRVDNVTVDPALQTVDVEDAVDRIALGTPSL